MRTLWRDDPASFQGAYVNFERVYCDTKPVQASGIPLLIGVSSEAAARRAGLRGDGFFPHVASPEDVALRMDQAHQAVAQAGRALGSR